MLDLGCLFFCVIFVLLSLVCVIFSLRFCVFFGLGVVVFVFQFWVEEYFGVGLGVGSSAWLLSSFFFGCFWGEGLGLNQRG